MGGVEDIDLDFHPESLVETDAFEVCGTEVQPVLTRRSMGSKYPAIPSP